MRNIVIISKKILNIKHLTSIIEEDSIYQFIDEVNSEDNIRIIKEVNSDFIYATSRCLEESDDVIKSKILKYSPDDNYVHIILKKDGELISYSIGEDDYLSDGWKEGIWNYYFSGNSIEVNIILI